MSSVVFGVNAMSMYGLSDSQRILLRRMVQSCVRGGDGSFSHVPYLDYPGPVTFNASGRELEAEKADLHHFHTLGLIQLTSRYPLHVEGFVTEAAHDLMSRDDSDLVDLALDSSIISGSSVLGIPAGPSKSARQSLKDLDD